MNSRIETSQADDATSVELQRVQVYFDGGCPVCSREIAFYQGLRAARSIEWVDVAAADFADDDLARADALSRLHVRATNGELVSGVAAFRTLWSQLPALRWLSLLSQPRVVQRLMERAYDLFLRRRSRPPAYEIHDPEQLR